MTGDGDMMITVNTVVNGDSFDILTNSGNINVTVGSNPGDVCEATPCATTTTLAANIADFINNHTNPEISVEHVAQHTTGTSVVIIRGAQVQDFYNGTSAMPFIGNISIRSVDNLWAIPFVDVNNFSQINILRNSNADLSLNGIVPSQSVSIATGQFNKFPIGRFLSSNEYVVSTINTNNNIDIYKFNAVFALDGLRDMGWQFGERERELSPFHAIDKNCA